MALSITHHEECCIGKEITRHRMDRKTALLAGHWSTKQTEKDEEHLSRNHSANDQKCKVCSPHTGLRSTLPDIWNLNRLQTRETEQLAYVIIKTDRIYDCGVASPTMFTCPIRHQVVYIHHNGKPPHGARTETHNKAIHYNGGIHHREQQGVAKDTTVIHKHL